MGLAANDSYLRSMCGVKDGPAKIQDINKAWGLQAGCTHRLSPAAVGMILCTSFWEYQSLPRLRPFSANNCLMSMVLLRKLPAKPIDEAGE